MTFMTIPLLHLSHFLWDLNLLPPPKVPLFLISFLFSSFYNLLSLVRVVCICRVWGYLLSQGEFTLEENWLLTPSTTTIKAPQLEILHVFCKFLRIFHSMSIYIGCVLNSLRLSSFAGGSNFRFHLHICSWSLAPCGKPENKLAVFLRKPKWP